MRQQLIKILACSTLLSVMAITTSCADAQNKPHPAEKNNTPDNLLYEKIEDYRQLYPDLTFLILQGGDDLVHDMLALEIVLGYQPVSLDYEHPAELREDLMYVSIERIWSMLKTFSPSSSLFRADTPLGWKKHICVLTINANKVAATQLHATQNLLNLSEARVKNIPQELQLPADDYLAFVTDHEIYHCLKSMYVGPQLMSKKELWGSYNHFLDEQAADTYALAMHIRNQKEDSDFVKNILRIRRLSLYNADPDHLTCKAIERLLKTPGASITEMSLLEIFELANDARDELDTGYDEYIKHLASTVEAMKEIGVIELVAEDVCDKVKDVQIDPEYVKELVEDTRRCFTELTGEEIKP